MFKKKSQTEENKSDKSKTQRKILCCIKKLKSRVKSAAAEPTTSEVEEESEGSEVEEEDVDQLQLMIDYINQDACEKADEIDTKTAELFLAEKAKHFEEEYSKIYEYYDKMETKYQASIHRFAANAINKGRLFVLRARANYVVEIIDEARGTLDTIANPQNQKYIETMKLLILEGLLMLLEPKVVLRVRNKDRNMVQDLLHSIRKQYRNVTEGKEVELVLDEHNLPLISKGGVILYDQLNRMVVTNTLSARLDLVAHKLLPEIRNALWSNKPFKIMEYMDLT